jgi:TPR repeat protein
VQPEEIRLLVQQGERFARDGDIVTARMLFERAAKAGDSAAALALAATYDPIVLTKSGVLGIDTDVAKARTWYQKAQSLGSAQALERLNALASR